MKWNSHTCACQCESEDCSSLNQNDVTYFFNPETCSCHCNFKEPALGNYWDMESCTERTVPDLRCSPLHGFQRYFNTALNKCVCHFPEQGHSQEKTFNIHTCTWDCLPQACPDSGTYYWDSIQCKCACYISECQPNFHWDSNECKCICNG